MSVLITAEVIIDIPDADPCEDVLHIREFHEQCIEVDALNSSAVTHSVDPLALPEQHCPAEELLESTERGASQLQSPQSAQVSTAPDTTVDVNVTLAYYQWCNPEEVAEVEANTSLRQGCDPEVDCTICLEEVQNGQHFTRLKCGHSFHSDCARNWIAAKLALDRAATCPNCNQTIITPVDKPPSQDDLADQQAAAQRIAVMQRPSSKCMLATSLMLLIFFGVASYVVIHFGNQSRGASKQSAGEQRRLRPAIAALTDSPLDPSTSSGNLHLGSQR